MEAREENLAAQIGEGGRDAGGGVWAKAWVAGRKRAQHCRGEAPYYFGEMRAWLNSQSRASEAAYYTGAGRWLLWWTRVTGNWTRSGTLPTYNKMASSIGCLSRGRMMRLIAAAGSLDRENARCCPAVGSTVSQ